jgi:hypothetical protein
MKAVLRDLHLNVTVFSLVLVFLLCAGNVLAQTSSTTPSPARTFPRGTPRSPDDPPLSSLEEEMNAKRAIKFAEKEHQENLDRAREIGEIGKELRKTLKAKASFDREFIKKVERLEKLTKKVRGEAGGEDEEVTIANRPSDVVSAVTQIAEVSESLSKDVQGTPRQVVSASVIGSANVLLELIKIFRAFAR